MKHIFFNEFVLLIFEAEKVTYTTRRSCDIIETGNVLGVKRGWRHKSGAVLGMRFTF